MAESFPEECRHVIELLAKVYKNDATTKEEQMTPAGEACVSSGRKADPSWRISVNG